MTSASVRQRFHSQYPGEFFLDAEDRPNLERYLRQHHWLCASETIRDMERAGEGNMNYTLRVRTDQRSFILKQARPWVEKYPDIPAPVTRATAEAHFYQIAGTQPVLARFLPKLLGVDQTAHLLCLQDLGSARDATSLYDGDTLPTDLLTALLGFLSALHSFFEPGNLRHSFASRTMRELNHAHMFVVPLDPQNGFALDTITPGLTASTRELQADRRYAAAVRMLGELYLQDGLSLLHGDFFPGSWLLTPDGPKIIDPEFCFFGPPEFDFGVLLAHLVLAQQPPALTEQAWQEYRRPPHFRPEVARGFAGVEVMRRLAGVAQLPVAYPLEQKDRLLQLSRTWVLG